jgi:hypothetical protein
MIVRAASQAQRAVDFLAPALSHAAEAVEEGVVAAA